MVSVWPQWWQPVGGPRDKIWDLMALVWPIRSWVITTSSALVRCWNFFSGPTKLLRCFTKLIELSLGFLSGDHAFTYSFNEVVSLGNIVMRSWWKIGCPQGADQFGIDLCRGHGFLYFEPMGGAGGQVMPPLPFGLGAYKSLVVRSNSCRTWWAGLSMQARVFT